MGKGEGESEERDGTMGGRVGEGERGAHGKKRGRLLFSMKNTEEAVNTKSFKKKNLHKTQAVRLHCTCLTERTNIWNNHAT